MVNLAYDAPVDATPLKVGFEVMKRERSDARAA
jgi:hypothetical protein